MPSRQKKRILALDWDPIVNSDDVVERVLVCVRDVTMLKELEKLNEERQQELEYISEVLSISEIAFAKFLRTGEDLLEENFRLVEGKYQRDSESLKIMFLNMHTLKGTSRGYGFRQLTTVIHDVEQSTSKYNKGDLEWNLKSSPTILKRFEAS